MSRFESVPEQQCHLSTALQGDRCRPQRILIVDEHELMQAGLRAVFSDTSWVETCLIAGSAEAGLQIARRHQVQLVLISSSIGGCSGLRLCRLIKASMPHVKVVLMAGEGRISAALARSAGASGALSKQMPSQTIVALVRRIVDGAQIFPKGSRDPEVQLSRRESDVLQHLAGGLSNPEVAAVLSLSRHTVKQHTSAIYRKLGVRNRAEAASRAQELGFVATLGGDRLDQLRAG